MARWFMLSYDATDELYDLTLYENTVTRGPRRIRRNARDFRKVIISILRTKRVLTMREPVKTTIIFLDESAGTEHQKLNYWFNAFGTLGDDFKFVVGAVLQYQDKTPILREFPDEGLNDGFQGLLAEVLLEEERAR